MMKSLSGMAFVVIDLDKIIYFICILAMQINYSSLVGQIP